MARPLTPRRILFGLLTPSSGGHTRTAIALADVLRGRGYTIEFLVTASPVGKAGAVPARAALISAAGFPIVTIADDYARFSWSSFRQHLRELVRCESYDVLHWFELTGLRAAALVAAEEGRGFLWSHTSGGVPPGYYGLNRVVLFTPEVAEDARRRSPGTAVHILPARLDFRALDRTFVDSARRDIRRRMGIADGELLVVRVARCSNVYLRSVRMGLELAMRLSREGQPARFLHAGYLEDTEIAREIRRLVDQANSQVGRSIAFSLTNDLEAGVRYLAAADVCVASGRSAIEALALGRPTFVAWGSRYLGLIDRENVESVAQTNFQGRNTKKVGSDEDTVSGMFAAVRARFAEPDRGARTQEVCARIIRERYSVESAAEAYERLYADRTVTIDGFLRHFSNPRQLGRDLFHRLPPGVRFSRPMNFLRKSAIWPGLQKTD